MTEAEIQRRIHLLSRGPVRLFRNNVGTGWAGPSTRVTPGNLAAARAALRPGDVVIRNGRLLRAGLAVGSGDLIGWRSITISPEHIGRQVAVFASIEVKAAAGRVRPEQREWLECVSAAGGIADVARDVDGAQGILSLGPGISG